VIALSVFHSNYLHARWITAIAAQAREVERPLKPQDLLVLIFSQVQWHCKLSEVAAEAPHHTFRILLGHEQPVIDNVGHSELVVIFQTTKYWFIIGSRQFMSLIVKIRSTYFFQ